MIVLLDTKGLRVELYTEDGIRSFSFEEADLLKEILRNKKVLYVTNGILATAEEIIGTVEAILQQRSEELKISGEIMYLRSSGPGVLAIQGLYNKSSKVKEDLLFENPFDAKLLNEIFRDYGKEIFKESRTMRNLLKSGKLQILGEAELYDLERRYKSGELKIRGNPKQYLKYMKLLAEGEDPTEPINMDITRSVQRAAATDGRSTGREDNESTVPDEFRMI